MTFTMLYEISESGTLVYAPGPVPDVRTSIYMVDWSGLMERIPFEVGNWTAWGPQLSPEGDRIVYWGPDPSGLSGGQAASRLWMYDGARQSVQPLTDAGAGDFWPIWAPDGQSVMFSSFRGGGKLDLYRVRADGTGTPEPLFSDDSDKQADSFSCKSRVLFSL
jgi:Tol biopolymer transport system component